MTDSAGFIDIPDDCISVGVGVDSDADFDGSDGIVEDTELSNVVKLSPHDIERRGKLRPGIL